MYYSSIGILAFLILIINNFFILTKSSKSQNVAHKAYRNFLFSVAAYYIADIIWSPLYFYTKAITITFAWTCIYFVTMALSVLFWTKYVTVYLNKKNWFAYLLKYLGIFFLCAQIIVLIINIFVPIAFWYEDDGSYHTAIARKLNHGFQIIMYLIVDIYMFYIVRITNGKIKRRHRAIEIFSTIMIIFVILQNLYPEMPFYAIGNMLGTCLLYTFVIEDEKEVRREELESIMQVEKIQELELGQTRHMAYTDPLTGVKNKMAYIEDVGGIEQRIEDGFLKDFGIIVFDLNDLKKTNDTLGHDAGDKYIQKGSSIICSKFTHSPVYRIGGDEFVVFLFGEDYKNHNSILKDFEKIINHNLETGDVVIAYGFADYAKLQTKGFMRLFEYADKQMYKCKQNLKAKKLKISQ